MYCGALCFAQDQKVAIALLRSGIKTFASAVTTTDPIRPLSASLLSVDSSEDFFTLQSMANDDIFIAASIKRIVVIKWHATKWIEIVDNLCVFPSDPLIDVCLRIPRLFCLSERSASVITLTDSTIKPVEKKQSNEDRVTNTENPQHQEKKKISASPISTMPAEKLTYELPPAMPSFKDLTTVGGSSDTNQRIALPFDCGRVRRIYYDAQSDRILLGGEILNVMVNIQGRYKISEDRVHNSYFACLSTPSGYIYLNDWVSNDLIVIDKRYKEANRYRGVPDHSAAESENLKYIQQSSQCLLWLAGPARVVRINYDTSMDEISLFDRSFIDTYNPIIQIVQGTADGCYYMVASLEGRGMAVIVCGKESTHVVPLSNVGGDSRQL